MEHLIPDIWFSPLAQPWLLLIAAIAILVLVKGADWLVEGASGIAYRFGIPKIIVGATIVSLGTTSPEAAVSVMAAWEGDAGLALGNAVGSIITDTGLIFGLGCLITVLPADRFVLKRQGWVKVFTDVLLAGLCFGMFMKYGDDAQLGRPIGVLLLALLVVYMFMSVRWGKEHPHGEPFIEPNGDDEKDKEEKEHSLMWLFGMGFMGLVFVLFASRFLIGSVEVLAEAHWHVPEAVIAGTLVAFGTSLPELVVGMTAIKKGHKELLVGNVIGADILNVLFVVGASAVASPLPIIEPLADNPRIFLWLHLPTMLAMTVLLRIYISVAVRKEHFYRWMGLPLLVMYVAYVVIGYVVD